MSEMQILLGVFLGVGGTTGATMLLKRYVSRIPAMGPPNDMNDVAVQVRAAPAVVYRDIPESEAERIRQGRIDRLVSQEADLARRLASLQDDVETMESRLNKALSDVRSRDEIVSQLRASTRADADKEITAFADEIRLSFAETLSEIEQALGESFEHLRLSSEENLASVKARIELFHREMLKPPDA